MESSDVRTCAEWAAEELAAWRRGDRSAAEAAAEVVRARVAAHLTGELLDVYDDDLRHTGVKDRGLVHLDGDWHRSFHCWLVCPGRGTMIVQRRSMAKATYPGWLDVSVAGHYRTGEGSAAGCREASEELGLEVAPESLISMGRAVDVARHGYLVDREVADVFLAVTEATLADLRPDPAEVAEVLELPLADAAAMFAPGDGVSPPCRASGRTAAGTPVASNVTPASFTSHHDRYYARVFLQARRVAEGLPPLPF